MKVALLLLALVAVAFANPQDINANLADGVSTNTQITTGAKLTSAKASIGSLRATLTATNQRLDGLVAVAEALEAALNILWVVAVVVMKVLLLLGFSMFEASGARRASLAQILTKNLVVIAVTAFGWWAWGYGNAYNVYYGDSTHNPFIGNGRVFLAQNGQKNPIEYGLWTNTYVIATFATLIATSSLTDRGSLIGYTIMTFLFSSFSFPVIAHWVWSTNGWLSVVNDHSNFGDNGMIDWAGSGVIGITAASFALAATLIAGPRMRRFEDDFNAANPARFRTFNKMYQGLGVLLMWIGVYGLTCGMSFVANGASLIPIKVSVNTTLACAAGALVAYFLDAAISAPLVDMKYVSAHPEDANPPTTKRTDMRAAFNGIIAGMISVLAGCAVYEPWAAFVVGGLGGVFAVAGPLVMAKVRIDDPVDTFSIFGMTGFWGLGCVGWFARHSNMVAAYPSTPMSSEGIWYDGSAEIWGVQVFGAFIICLFTIVVAAVFIVPLKIFGILRVSEDQEAWGLDSEVPQEEDEEEMIKKDE